MFPPFPFVVLWPFVQNLYLATSKSLQNIWKNWLPFLWSSPVGLHSSHSLHTVLHSHIYFPHSFVYIQFYHISSHFPARVKTMLCFNTHYSLLFLTLHFLTDRVEYLFPEWQWKKNKYAMVKTCSFSLQLQSLLNCTAIVFQQNLYFQTWEFPSVCLTEFSWFFLRRCAFFKCQ